MQLVVLRRIADASHSLRSVMDRLSQGYENPLHDLPDGRLAMSRIERNPEKEHC